MSRVLVATTLAAYVMDQKDTWSAWLTHADAIRDSHPDGVDFFAAIEVDARAGEPFQPLFRRLNELDGGNGGSWWTFKLDDGRTEVTTANRLRHITFGQNLAMDAACAGDYSHLLFVAADCAPPPDVLPKLIAVGEHVVAPYVPTYGLPTRPARTDDPSGLHTGPWNFPVHTAVAPDVLCFSAAAVLLDREAFRLLRWRWDRDVGMTDDPCLQRDAWYNHGWQVYVRPDVVARHYPQAIGAVETRGHDMTVVRS